jgi:methionine-S-sulfoxide reductase
MTMTKKRMICLAAVAAFGLSAPSLAQAQRTETAVFAGGCFWTVEYKFEQIEGVSEAVSGFSGGDQVNPTYEQVVSGQTNHYEAVEVTYDPSKVTYRQLVDEFWLMIDPTDAGGQACDRGSNYRTAIFTGDQAERQAALASRDAVNTGPRQGKIVTQIRAERPFYAADASHQDFYKTNPARYEQYRAGCGRDRIIAQIWADKLS